MRTVRQRRHALVLPGERTIISSVNGNAPPYSGQPGVVILGFGFGAVQGTLHYDTAQVTAIASWTDTRIVCLWPDLPFSSVQAANGYGIPYPMRVTRPNGVRATVQISTVKFATDIYRQITAIANPGIFANDVGVAVGNYFNWRTISGTVTDVDSTGRPRGTSVGARGRYAVWNGTVWTNTAQSIIQIS